MPARTLRLQLSAAAIVVAVFGLAMLWASSASAATGLRDVVFVGNNWDGTADVIDPHQNYRRVTRINIIPDLQERLLEIYMDPVRLGYFLAIRELVGEGHDQYVDDMYSTPDGRLLVVSRPSLADVVAINLDTRQIVWRFQVDGQRSDHMAMSPDGRRVAVSASTANDAKKTCASRYWPPNQFAHETHSTPSTARRRY